MKTTLYLIMIAILATNTVALNEVIQFTVTLDNTGFYIEDSRISVDQASTNDIGNYLYEFRLVDKEGNILTTNNYRFTLAVDEESNIDSLTQLINIYHNKKAEKLEIYKEGLVLSYDLPEFCNYDGYCSRHETFYSCEDCESYDYDNICVGAIDQICETDCDLEDDLDCYCGNTVCDDFESTTLCPEDCRTEEQLYTEQKDRTAMIIGWTLWFSGFILLLFLIWLYHRIRQNET